MRRRLTLEDTTTRAPEIAPWIAALKECRKRTADAVSEMDRVELDWRPPGSGSTVGSLLYHVAAIEADWLHTEIRGEEIPPGVLSLFPQDVRDEAGHLAQIGGEALATHLDRLGRVREALLSTLGGMSMEDFRRLRTLEEYDVSPEWVVQHLIQHESVHRGQVLLIRRSFKEGGPS